MRQTIKLLNLRLNLLREANLDWYLKKDTELNSTEPLHLGCQRLAIAGMKEANQMGLTKGPNIGPLPIRQSRSNLEPIWSTCRFWENSKYWV